ncbi:unnamed protein product [Blepharisma stoltei]|uniref:Maturase K n=1 Tax=Blepharisma stoltei TaxID=1481888 RepID=A0AAU9K2Z5_9CILI|nr:unnamed protein product [Blepharisma stoltei]
MHAAIEIKNRIFDFRHQYPWCLFTSKYFSSNTFQERKKPQINALFLIIFGNYLYGIYKDILRVMKKRLENCLCRWFFDRKLILHQ